VVREQLEKFVSDIALLELEPQHTVKERRKALHQQHTQLMTELFAHILTADLWTDGQGESIEQLLLSPTVDSADQQLIVSAITLASMNCYDMVKFRTLIHVYQQSTDEYVRQRALFGWVFSLDNELEEFLFPEMRTLVEQTVQNPNCMKELIELQEQFFYCLSADEDRNTIEKEIMPELLKNQQKMQHRDEQEQDEENILNDILHPDAEEQEFEKLENTFHRMIDMQKQGSDVYFGGFSQMKRYPFFNEISNWFTPFFTDHPGVAHTWDKYGNVKFLSSILEFGPFCNSDKYSFLLAFETVLNGIPENVRQMLDRGEAVMYQKLGTEEMSTPAYIRRIYLQDMFRFFRLNPLRNEFKNVFEKDSFQSMFITRTAFDNTDIQAHFKEVVAFLIKRNQKNYAKDLLANWFEEKYHDYDYYMLKGYLGDNVEDSYRKALELNPQSERALLGLARIWFKHMDYEKALDAYNQLLEMNADKKSYQLNKAICLTNLCRFEEAEQILFRLNFEDADNLHVVRVLAWALTGDGKYEQAGRLYDQLLAQENPEDSDSINYGFYLWFTGKIDDAANCFRSYVTNAKPKDERWATLHSIIYKESDLLEMKGITDREIQMMIDWVDVYNA
jgi:tetratricopeptide (TPR) repeat protein